VYCWDGISRLWYEANDAAVAVLYYDWMREILRDMVREAAAKNEVEDSPLTIGETRDFSREGGYTTASISNESIAFTPPHFHVEFLRVSDLWRNMPLPDLVSQKLPKRGKGEIPVEMRQSS